MSDSALDVTIPYPEAMSRGTLLLKTFLGWLILIPHWVIGIFYGIGVMFVTFIAWFAILFTGSYPRGMFDFVTRFLRWQLRVHAYTLLMTDTYPPFSGSE